KKYVKRILFSHLLNTPFVIYIELKASTQAQALYKLILLWFTLGMHVVIILRQDIPFRMILIWLRNIVANHNECRQDCLATWKRFYSTLMDLNLICLKGIQKEGW
ncbi:hypothetical protein ACJX0J_027035, partial [Zea mays]